MVWSPPDPLLDRWREIYLAVTRRNGAEADAGRRLLRWAREAGFQEIAFSTSNWTFATPGDRSWWSEMWAERTTSSAFGQQAVEYGIASAAELEEIAAGWRGRGGVGRSWGRVGGPGGRPPPRSSSGSAARSSPAAETDQASRASRSSCSP